MATPYLSLIIACYNEGPSLPNSLQSVLEVLSELPYAWEMICIDDKSLDESFHNLKTFSKGKRNVKVFAHKKNLGRGGTVKQGILKAQGKVVGYIDIDLEVSAVYIPQFVRAIEKGADVAIANRIYQENIFSITRWLASKSYSFIVRLMLDLNLYDTEAGYKFFNRKKILKTLRKTENKHWFFDTEILVRSKSDNLKINQIPVLFLRRNDKKSTVRLIPDTIAYIKAIYNFKNKHQ